MHRLFSILRVVRLSLALLLVSAIAAQAAGDSPYDAYYKQQAAGTGAPPPVTDNDQYYIAPGQYMPNGQYVAPPAPTQQPRSKGCSSIGDSPQCLGD